MRPVLVPQLPGPPAVEGGDEPRRLLLVARPEQVDVAHVDLGELPEDEVAVHPPPAPPPPPAPDVRPVDVGSGVARLAPLPLGLVRDEQPAVTRGSILALDDKPAVIVVLDHLRELDPVETVVVDAGDDVGNLLALDPYSERPIGPVPDEADIPGRKRGQLAGDTEGLDQREQGAPTACGTVNEHHDSTSTP